MLVQSLRWTSGKFDMGDWGDFGNMGDAQGVFFFGYAKNFDLHGRMKNSPKSSIDKMPIHHLTMNTGHVTVQQPERTGSATIKILKPLVKMGTAPVPSFSKWHFKLEKPAATWCYIEITNPKSEPVVFGVLAWEKNEAEEAWKAVEELYFLASDKMAEMGFPESVLAHSARPTDVPWLAVILTPTAFLANPFNLLWLGDFENCLARTILHVEAESSSD